MGNGLDVKDITPLLTVRFIRPLKQLKMSITTTSASYENLSVIKSTRKAFWPPVQQLDPFSGKHLVEPMTGNFCGAESPA